MMKNILNFWKGKDFLTKELEDFEQMISDAESIYRIAVNQLMSEDSPGLKLRDEVYQTDQNINLLQRKIRSRLVSHLSFQPTEDLTTSLILMSVVKDAERLGDYSKNIFEISDLLHQPFKQEYFDKWFKKSHEQLLEMFGQTKSCFIQSDEELARKIMDIERGILKGCDEGLHALANSDINSNLAVCATLVYRYFKRVGAHLGNIATSVIMPITDLDYFDEKRRLGGDNA